MALSKPQVPLYLGATAGLRELHDRDRDEAGESPSRKHVETSQVSCCVKYITCAKKLKFGKTSMNQMGSD